METGESKARKLWVLFSTFFKISALTVGGGYAMIPVMEQEFVRKKRWINAEDIVDVIAVVQSLPGIIAGNIAVFIGYRIAGVAGALAAVFGAVLPSFAVIVVIAMFMMRLGEIVWLGHAFAGVRAGVCALVLLSAWSMAGKILKGRFEWTVAAISLVGIVMLKFNPIWMIAGGATAGGIRYYLALRRGAASLDRTEKPL